MSFPLIEFRNAKFGYGRKIVLESVSIDIRRGDLLGLVGPNGSGKTTLLRGMLGQLSPLAGEVLRPQGRPSRIGFMPQRENLNPIWPLRVIDVALMGRLVLRGPLRRFTADDIAEATRALDAAGIAHLAREPVSRLSGGQVQRALLARALAAQPEILVLDEPTTGMDLGGSTAMLRLIRSLHKERQLTVLFVSHDLNAVAAVATRIVLLHEGVVREGDAETILSADILGQIYHLDVVIGNIAGHHVVAARDARP
ncbi:MAG: ABC transporter ATP-binding protein [Candidatus Hydrogenedentota bacterium]